MTFEVFTTTGFPISGKDGPGLPGATVTVYAADGLAQFEADLSRDLPTDAADAAKTEALRRISQLNEPRMTPAKDAALGLAKAVQYGVDRYPAIVLVDLIRFRGFLIEQRVAEYIAMDQPGNATRLFVSQLTREPEGSPRNYDMGARVRRMWRSRSTAAARVSAVTV